MYNICRKEIVAEFTAKEVTVCRVAIDSSENWQST